MNLVLKTIQEILISHNIPGTVRGIIHITLIRTLFCQQGTYSSDCKCQHSNNAEHLCTRYHAEYHSAF